MGTSWEHHGEKQKSNTPTILQKKKNLGLWVHAASLIGYKKCFCLSVLFAIFGLV
jgi:hypothetical protein